MPLKSMNQKFQQTVTNANCNYIRKPGIGIMVRAFANGPGDLGSIPGRVIPDSKMVLDASLLNSAL